MAGSTVLTISLSNRWRAGTVPGRREAAASGYDERHDPASARPPSAGRALADAYLFLRNSDFTFTDTVTGAERVDHVRQHNPQARIYVSMTTR